MIPAIRVVLRGKAHAEWKVVVSGDRRTVKDDQVFVEERTVIWGKGINIIIILSHLSLIILCVLIDLLI